MSTYYGIVDKDPDSAYGIYFPDVPLCFSAADEIEDLLPNAIEALSISAEYEALPPPRTIEEIRQVASRDLAEGAFILAVPVVNLSGRTVRANITMDSGLLESIDETAKSRRLTRSAFLAQVAKQEIYGGHVAEDSEEFEHGDGTRGD